MKTLTKAKRAGIGNAAVKEKTGRSWSEWISLLNKWRATDKTHAEIAKYLHGRYKLSAWWSQMVTVGYEQASGRREVHQRSGGFAVCRSRTVNGSAAKMFLTIVDPGQRGRWLNAAGAAAKSSKAGRSVNLIWGDKSSVRIELYSKGADKCQIVVDHTKIADATVAEHMKTFWSAALDKLKASVER